ncbi:MAG: ABC transporter ATP-binding protein [Patescibacteria group bacterium]
MPQRKPRDKNGFKALLSLARYLAPQGSRLACAFILMLTGSCGVMYFPYAARIAIDRYITPRRIDGFPAFIACTAGVMILAALANAWRTRIMANVGQRTIRRIRLDLFTHLQRLPVAFFDRMPVGKVMTRLTSDVDALAELFSGTIVQMVGDVLICAGFVGIMLALDWRMALVAMASLPPMLFVFTFLSGRIHRAEDEVRERASTVNAILQENVSGIKVIQAFCAERRFGERFEEANQTLLRAGLRAVRVFGFFWPIVDATWTASSGWMLLAGGYFVLKGTLTVGGLAAFMGYAGEFFGPLRGLSQAYRVIQRALAGAVRINAILAEQAEHDAILPAMPPVRGRVEFEGVTFGYDQSRTILRGINLTVSPGQLVALVGRTGAGKTSLINLLCRFYTPQAGVIRVDGVDINATDLHSYRSQIALVLQEPFLFSGTIRDNLRYGKKTATDEEMLAALRAAGLLEIADQGLGLDSVLHERGGNLSSGQRQLLSFARAILAEPRLIILDEATAHVDTITERKVQAAMAHLLAGRTAFVIAHRLSTIQAADQIVVIEEGEIAERGRHEELLAARGGYWRLCREQNVLTRGELVEEDTAAEA